MQRPQARDSRLNGITEVEELAAAYYDGLDAAEQPGDAAPGADEQDGA